MGGRGGPGNYYAITHKPIDLDWTPGGRAARSWARPDLLQDHARKLKCIRYIVFDKIFMFSEEEIYLRNIARFFYLLMLTHVWQN